MRRGRAHTGGNRGFTLLELLIAMSLLGLIFAALTGGLRFGTTAWQKAADRLSHSDDLRLVYRTLRRQISTAVFLPGNPVSGDDKGAFEGYRDRVSFVGLSPARAMTPGLFRLTLALAPDAGAQALTLTWQRLGKTGVDAGSDNTEPILRGVRSIEFSYFGMPENRGTPRWVNEWRDTNQSPRLMKISVAFAERDRVSWPTMIIPIVAPEG